MHLCSRSLHTSSAHNSVHPCTVQCAFFPYRTNREFGVSGFATEKAFDARNLTKWHQNEWKPHVAYVSHSFIPSHIYKTLHSGFTITHRQYTNFIPI